MEDAHVFPRKLHLLGVEDVKVLHANVVLFVEEAFLLDAGHVEYVQVRERVLQPDHFFKGNLIF